MKILKTSRWIVLLALSLVYAAFPGEYPKMTETSVNSSTASGLTRVQVMSIVGGGIFLTLLCFGGIYITIYIRDEKEAKALFFDLRNTIILRITIMGADVPKVRLERTAVYERCVRNLQPFLPLDHRSSVRWLKKYRELRELAYSIATLESDISDDKFFFRKAKVGGS